MNKHIYLASGCLLSSILLQADSIQQETYKHVSGDETFFVRDADEAILELSALTQSNNPATTRSLCGSSHCDKQGGCFKDPECCTKLQCRRIINTLNIVESKMCLLTECEPIPLSSGDVTGNSLTINNPGSYCLSSDITGNTGILSLVINASQVTLDLNCHQITGSISVASGLGDIFITNGVVDLDNATGNAIDLPNDFNNIQLSELTIQMAGTHGIGASGGNNLFISNALVENSGNNGINLAGTQNVFISDSLFFNNGQDGFISTSDANVTLIKCNSEGNTQNGFSTLGEQAYLFDCIARENALIGFSGSQNAFNCIAENNTSDGFSLSNRTYLENCVAINNLCGFRISTFTSGTLNRCVALNNTDNGFIDLVLGTSVTYISNYAQDNTSGDYSPNPGPFNPMPATAAGISYWYNTLNA